MGASSINPDEQLRRDLLSDRLSSGKGNKSVENRAYAIAFREWFGLAPQPSRVLVMLYQGHAAAASADSIAAEMRTTKAGVHRHICDIRKAMDTEALDCTRTEGYRLTEDGMAECRAVLWQVGETLRMAS